MSKEIEAAIGRKAAELGKLVVEMTTEAGSGHPSSALSLAHIVTTLMYQVMRHNPKDPCDPTSDRLVLSEGHAVPIVYAAYADLEGSVGQRGGAMRQLGVEDLKELRKIDSVLDGHPNPAAGFPFFDAATGSLGQGLSIAAGLVAGARLDDEDRRVFAILGDGESREGQVWEAVDFIVEHKLTGVVTIFNANGLGQSDYVSGQQSPEALARKAAAYGMEVREVNGHDAGQLLDALGRGPSEVGVPVAVVARTQKGWGVSALQGTGRHGKPLTEEELEGALADLEAERVKAGSGEMEMRPSGTGRGVPTVPKSGRMSAPDFEAMLEGDAFLKKFRSKRLISTRRAYGLALRELGRARPDVVALDGDVSNSTFSDYFQKAFGERFFECRIAEQNMVGVVGGLAAAGKIPFASSFGKFLVRGYDQMEMNINSGHNMKLMGSHTGASLGADGPSQMGLVDVAFFRSFPTEGEQGTKLVVFNPADGYAAYRMVELAARHVGPVYIRTGRDDVALIYDAQTRFEIGGAHALAQGDDVILVATGYMVHAARQAVETLSEMGISAGLIDAYSFPIQSELIREIAAERGRKVLTVEDNYGGGLGSAIAELAAEAKGARVWRMTVPRIPKSGRSGEKVLAWLGLAPQDIAARAKTLAETS